MVPAKNRPSLSQAPSLNLVNDRASGTIGLLRYEIELPSSRANPLAVVQANYINVTNGVLKKRERQQTPAPLRRRAKQVIGSSNTSKKYSRVRVSTWKT